MMKMNRSRTPDVEPDSNSDTAVINAVHVVPALHAGNDESYASIYQ